MAIDMGIDDSKHHLKEWRKSNYFGGCETSDNESSLSYKSIDSAEINEYENSRENTSSNGFVKF
jgi:hypothetical protein